MATAGRSAGYAVRVGDGTLSAWVERLAAEPPSGLLAVVSDSNVAPLHGEALVRSLAGAGVAAELLVFPAGESHKTRSTKAALEDRLAEVGLGRDGLVAGLGGGVTTDLAGYLAATWMRGVALVQLPTSLLAMVDAAIGGKTGVNHPAGKNLVGAFHQPREVVADTALLATLPAAAFRDGFAEVVKAAAIADRALLERLVREAPALTAREPAGLQAVVGAAVAVKARIVEADVHARDARAILNFGHTAAHAIEAASDHRVSHGQAVAIGMLAEARAAAEAGRFPREQIEPLRAALAAFGLPERLPQALDPERLEAAMRRDKKVAAARLRIAVPAALGSPPPAGETTFEIEARALLVQLALD